ncbi:MAG TPA: CsgG/HfaB family protein [Thermoanaerobaculia bacterium]|nr:CsgG/HfaB family protein [Thermoanaerobaculia bacterium]
MKSIRLTTACLGIILMAGALMAPSASGMPASGSLRYSVFVEKFEDKSGSSAHLGGDWETQLTAALQESGRFIVVAQQDMQKAALKEQARGASGVTAQGRKTAARSRLTPAQLLVKGVITDFKQSSAGQGGFGIGPIKINAGGAKTEIRATIQMIDATTGTLVAAKNFTGAARNRGGGVSLQGTGQEANAKVGQDADIHAALAKAIDDVIPWMVGQLPSIPWRGSVVKVAGERIIINRGSREGVAEGDEFIAGESELLTDPDTGESLDEIVHERARIRVLKVSERTSICSVVGGDANHIIEGMGIQKEQGKGKG